MQKPLSAIWNFEHICIYTVYIYIFILFIFFWIFPHSKASHDVDEFVSYYITCSPMDPLQWMGAVRMGVQTADKNITIVHK